MVMVARQTSARVAVLDWPARRDAQAELRARLRPPRADPAARCPGRADPIGGGRSSRTAADRLPVAGGGHGPRPRGLLPHLGTRRPAPDRRAGRGAIGAARLGRGLAPGGLPRSRGAPAPVRRGPSAALALRLVDLGAAPNGATVRLPISPGDLH